MQQLKHKQFTFLGYLFIIFSFFSFLNIIINNTYDYIFLFAYLVYIFFTIFYINFKIKNWFSIDAIFIILSFGYFSLQFLFANSDLNKPFFLTEFYSLRFSTNVYNSSIGFGYFLVGYISFLLAYNSVNFSFIRRFRNPEYYINRLLIISFLFVISEFAFRRIFNVGVPGYQTGTIRNSGYIYYPLLYGSVLLSNLYFFVSLKRKSSFHINLSVFIILLRAFFIGLLGWKYGILYAFIYIGLIFYYYKATLRLNNKIFNNKSKLLIGLGLIITIAAFPILTNYRNFITLNDDFSFNAFFIVVGKTFDNFNLVDSFYQILRRTQGLANLNTIITYDTQFGIGTSVSFLDNLLDPTSLRPEIYYTFRILGVDPRILTQNAPTSWGSFYIYGGLFGIVTGLIFFGIMSKLIYKFLVTSTLDSGRSIVFYSVFITNIFIPVVFEGTIILYLARNLTIFIFMYILIFLVLDPLLTSKKLIY
jgi:hypothetical protein